MKLRYLHLSNLHFDGNKNKGNDVKKFNQSLVTDSMLEFLKKIGELDFIIVTGDIAYSARQEDYNLATTFFSELLYITGVKNDHLYIVPGNHDVNREEFIPNCHYFKNQDDITRALKNQELFKLINSKFNEFNNFVNKLIKKKLFTDNVFYKVYTPIFRKETSEIQLNLVGLNSALFCGYDNDDQHNLALGLYQVKNAFNDLSNDALMTISFYHHPSSCFHKEDKESYEMVKANSDIILTGHIHECENFFQYDSSGRCAHLGVGAGYMGRREANSLNITELNFDEKKAYVQYYESIYHHGIHWIKNLHVNPTHDNGIFSFPIKIKGRIPPETPPKSNYQLSKYLDMIYANSLLSGC